ncbi:DMT family transporter [Alteribacillus bidgolensis]|uniref:Permease of the drug/metabolite transporter (DMT) superfamily n=1 Tax=Alteribacillus bidgolensis TaxID=930129 RepID=A0A1G8Q1P5_9BACI|nr:DMT family transporter [Alteribacillus bidgolensis]SDI98641.1 Permease of the drug/metabolite transporter (DMT) superfamily [Alteribacillus bidgolensis]
MNIGFLYIIIVMIFLGISIPVGDYAMETIPVWLFTALTLTVSSIILLPAAKIYDKVEWKNLGVKNYYGIFMQALFTCVLYTVFLLYGLSYTNVIAAGVINSMVPAIVLLLSFLLLGERLNIRKIIAISLAVFAVLIMEVVGVRAVGEASWLGNIFMILAVTSLAMFYVYAKKFAVQIPPLTMSAGLCVMGLFMTLPMAVFESLTFDWESITAITWATIVAYAFSGWVLAYTFTYLGMPKVPASTVGMATAIIPITATVFAVSFLGETLRVVDGVALVLVIISIFIAESKDNTDNALENSRMEEISYNSEEQVNETK